VPQLNYPVACGGCRESLTSCAADTVEEELQPHHVRPPGLAADAEIPTMVRLAKIRWRIEDDYRELKTVSDLTISKAAAGPAGTATPPWPPPPTSFSPGSGNG
jgi:hypothetical protein